MTQVDVRALRVHEDPRIDKPLATWRKFRAEGRLSKAGKLPASLRELAVSVHNLFGWGDEKARGAVAPAERRGQPASSGGPAGLLQLAERVGRGEISMAQAHQAAAELEVSDDDVVFLVAFCAKDPVHGDKVTAGAMMQLAGMTVKDDALGGRLLRTLAALASDPQQVFELFRLADIRLTGGADDALRAEVWNEIAILLVKQGRYEQSTDKAQAARDLALKVGADRIALMAMGNIAFSLMQQRRFDEAIDILERLAVEQSAAGDTQGLEITRSNIAACKAQLGR